MKKYEVILMDLDDTLIDDGENRAYAFSKILENQKEEITEEKINKFKQIDKEFWMKKAAGEIETPKIEKLKDRARWSRAQRFLIFFDNITLEEAMHLNDIYIKALQEYIVGIKDAKDILKYLKNKNYRIYITTNGPKDAVEAKLKSINSLEYITDFFCAEEIGYMKPTKQYFQGLMKKIKNNDTNKMIIIGDELDKDIKGGIEHNIDSCWFNSNKIKNDTPYKPTYEIHNLEEIRNIL